uniref:Uncharacterized protein n=1 Tax=Zea mays TaxID=4577 RepID=C0PBC4_MAIZE|nr:unknown [Zea mays]
MYYTQFITIALIYVRWSPFFFSFSLSFELAVPKRFHRSLTQYKEKRTLGNFGSWAIRFR